MFKDNGLLALQVGAAFEVSPGPSLRFNPRRSPKDFNDLD
jgi:hypothetical protein